MNNSMKALRKKQKLTIQDVAETLGIPKSTYRQYEAGERNMKPETLIQVSEFFGVPIDEIFLHRLPPRYVKLSEDEQKVLAVYRTLAPEHQRLIRVMMNALSPSGEVLRRTDGGLRMASRNADTDDEDFPLPDEQDCTEIPDDI